MIAVPQKMSAGRTESCPVQAILYFYFRVYNRIAQDIKVPFKLNGADRIDDTPLHKALREALANALIHADYYDRRGLVIKNGRIKFVLQIRVLSVSMCRRLLWRCIGFTQRIAD